MPFMSHNPVPSLVLAAALSGCVLQPELLNSERIEERFGSYGIEILDQDDKLRRSSLYSTDAGVRTCRTYAIIQFMDSSATGIQAAHQAVLSGQSLGSTFRDAGWSITKETLYVGGITLSDLNSELVNLMRIALGERLAMHAYRLVLERGAQAIHYATIIEVHHPDYLGIAELHELYPLPEPSLADGATVNGFVRLVQSD
jgi:hypothetical protein